jgi:hypothetical protein
MRHNITLHERLIAHKNPVFLSLERKFYNPFDRGIVNNLVEFFMTSPICCCISGNNEPTMSEIVRKEFPDGIKNSVLTKPKTQRARTSTSPSYEPIERDSTIEGAQDDDGDEEMKVGDADGEDGKDLRYDIYAIYDNSI